MNIVRRFILNVGSSWVAMVVRIGANVLLLPYLVHKVGESSYGVWRTVAAFLICASMLDFGLSLAIRRYAARFAALRSDQDQQHLMSTTSVVYAGAALVAMLAALLIAPFSPSLFKDIPQSLTDPTIQLFYLVGVIAFLRLLGTPFMGFLQGLQHIHTTNIATITSNLIRLGGTIAVMELVTPSIVHVGWVTLAGEFVGVLTVIVACFRVWPGLRIRIAYFSKRHLRQISGFAVNSFIIMLSGLALYQLPNFIIGKWIGPVAVTLYAAGALLSMTIREVVGGLASVLMPMFSESHALENQRLLESRLWQGSLIGNIITWMIVVGVLIYAEPLIVQWLGRNMLPSYWPLIILVAGEASAGFSSATSSALAGYGHLKWLMISRVLSAGVGLALAVVAAEYLGWGIAGVALAVTIPNTMRGFWLTWYCSRRLGVAFWAYLARSAGRPLAAVGLVAAVCVLFRWAYPVTSRLDLLLSVLILGVCAAAVGLGIGLNAAMRRRLLEGALAKVRAGGAANAGDSGTGDTGQGWAG